MFLISCTNISPNFILILRKISEKQKAQLLMCSNVVDDVTEFEFIRNVKIYLSWERNVIIFQIEKIRSWSIGSNDALKTVWQKIFLAEQNYFPFDVCYSIYRSLVSI